MPIEDRYPDCGGRKPHFGTAQDLAGFGDDLALFAGSPVLLEVADLGDEVEGDLMGEDRALDPAGIEHADHLGREFFGGATPSA